MRERGMEPPRRRLPIQTVGAMVEAPVGFIPLRMAPTVKIDWPVSAVGDCGAWLRDWLR